MIKASYFGPVHKSGRKGSGPLLNAETKVKVAQVVWEYTKALIQAGILAAIIITFIAQSHLVDGASMEHTLFHRERLMVDKISYRFITPKRGEIIVFRYPQDPRTRFVKRVIGVPGDRIEIRERQVFVNGIALDEPYINGPTYGTMAPVVVEDGHVFVLGDNRNNSLDSRYPAVGQIPYNMIVGRALFSYWPIKAVKLIRIPKMFSAVATASS